uniref:Reverse transcriptase domain-containing protein n=1 Tax=Meloidogyne enterolobii TaxID=390850 RepID=A0A6V7U5E6_MELEN|nr:unnamed protein product [Meloidogyne enterolobii]
MNLSSTTPGPTRNDAYLDICLTNKPDLFHDIYVDGSLFNSDHDALIFDLLFPIIKKEVKPIKYRQYNKTNTILAYCINIFMEMVMEMVLNKYIVQFLLDNNLFSKDQYGFIKNRSTTTQLISTLEDWYDAIMGKKNIDCIYIDFKKAFDSVPHDLLINKLYRIGIRGKKRRKIKSLLPIRF